MAFELLRDWRSLSLVASNVDPWRTLAAGEQHQLREEEEAEEHLPHLQPGVSFSKHS